MAGRALLLAASVVALNCSSSSDDAGDEDDEGALQGETNRDFSKAPVIETVSSYSELYAMSDMHGHYDRFVDLLKESGLIKKADEDTPPKDLEWAGGKAILVVTGDSIDKGDKSVEVLEGLMSLETKAARAGGRVIFTLGNHEAEFLANPLNDKAAKKKGDSVGINVELSELPKPVKPEQFASWDDPHGKWLRTRPLAAKVGEWFFSHGGSTSGMSLKDLRTELEEGLKTKGYKAPALIGDDSILEAQEWYGKKGKKDDYSVAEDNAKALGVDHIVFGHDPGALVERGVIRERDHGLLFAIDTGLGAQDSKGYILHVSKSGSKITAEAISHVHGEKPEKLWDN
jgi:hypothetical protein